MARSHQTHARLTLKIGHWFEAHATGWAVALVPLLLLLMIAGGAVALAPHRIWPTF